MSEAYTVHRYSIEELKKILAAKSEASPEAIDRKFHCVYFEHYFDALGAKTIVCENRYVDRDYLDDYAGYYVRCFKDYKKTCTRLHFFDVAFEQREFDELLERRNNDLLSSLRTGYLGFVVVKPLPQTIIGRTCLKTYPHENRRFYQVTRDYDARRLSENI